MVLGTKTQALVSKVKKIKTIPLKSEIQAFLLESDYIKRYKPKYNIKLTDDKAYPLIRITVKDIYPKVLIARKAQDKNSIYFGPFPNAASALALTLKTIRRIFPYQSVLNHPKKLCLYYHLNLCPCPEVLNDKEYKTNINHLIDFLNGKTKKVIKELEIERDKFGKLEEFEKADLIQKKINAIKLITGPFYKTGLDFNIDPNLKEDLLSNALSSLRYTLYQNKVYVKKLQRIECYDISNIAGTNATGSMVVFTNGEKDSSQYRRFRIKNFSNFPNLPNDFAMMREILSRRLSHKEWPMPDLIIVDGGKGQVSSGLKVLQQMDKNIPLIGLAKRQESIITSNFKEIVLPKHSEGLKLVMKIRDEAHRFAITYHRKLRSKNFLKGVASFS